MHHAHRATNFERECHFAGSSSSISSFPRTRRAACRFPAHPCGPLACANMSMDGDSESQSILMSTCGERQPRAPSTSERMPRWRIGSDNPLSNHSSSGRVCAGHVLSGGCDPPIPHLGESACSPFARVALVVLATRVERVRLLASYSSWFASVSVVVLNREGCEGCAASVRDLSPATFRCVCAMDVAIGENASARELLTKHFDRLPSGKPTLGNLHPVLAEAMMDAARRTDAGVGRGNGTSNGRRKDVPPRLRGVAFMHADFALAPRHWALDAAAFDDFWTPRAGLYPGYRDPCCFRVSAMPFQRNPYPGKWGWYADSHAKCAEAAKALGFDECCFGWSDFVYVPISALYEYARVLSSPPMRRLFHEVAIPTTINLLASRHRRAEIGAQGRLGTGSTAQWRLLPRCQGSSVAARLEMQQLAVLRESGHCGHRLDLSLPLHRWALQKLLQPRTGPLGSAPVTNCWE